MQPARRRDVAAERRGGRQDAKDELRLGPRLCLAAYRVPGWQVLEHRAVEIAKNESNPDANGTLQHLLGKRSWKWKWKRSGGLFNSGWDCDFDSRSRRVARTRWEYYADYHAKHEDGYHIVACGHGIDERMNAAVQAESILLQLQHHGDDHIRWNGGDDKAVR